MKYILVALASALLLWGAYLMGQARGAAAMQYAVDTYARAYVTMRAAQADQAQAVRDWSRADARALADATKRLRVAQRETREAQTVAAKLMRPLTATEACARVDEADRRLLETLGR